MTQQPRDIHTGPEADTYHQWPGPLRPGIDRLWGRAGKGQRAFVPMSGPGHSFSRQPTCSPGTLNFRSSQPADGRS